MRAFDDMNLTRKFLAAPTVVLASLLLLGTAAYLGLDRQRDAIREIFDVRVKSGEAVSGLLTRALAVHGGIYKAICWSQAGTDAARVDDLAKRQLAELAALRGDLAAFSSNPRLNREEAALAAASQKSLALYAQRVAETADMLTTDAAVATTFLVPAEKAFEEVNRQLGGLSDLERRLSRETYGKSARDFGVVIGVFCVVFLGAAVLSGLLSVYLGGRSVAHIRRAIGLIEKGVARGDLSVAIDARSTDELGSLLRSMEEMRRSLRENVESISAVSGQVGRASEDLLGNVRSIAGLTGEEAARTGQVAASTAQLSASIGEIASNVDDIAAATASASQAARKGADIVSKTVEEVSAGVETAGRSAELMASLSGRSHEIKEISGVIDDIADQTNLLALNAAIEAARAGDHGRGFAVVADEVRKLAEKTSKATREINTIISAIQSETVRAAEAMAGSSKRLASGLSLTREAGEALSEIVGNVQGLQHSFGEIATATREISEVSGQIRTDTVAMVDAADQASARAAEMEQDARSLAALYGDLNAVVGHFKLH